MAFPLIFMDEHGVVTTYQWREYPLQVVQTDPKFVGDIGAEWCSEDIFSPSTILNTVSVVVWCGPAAPLPEPPTAEQFREAVYKWLFR